MIFVGSLIKTPLLKENPLKWLITFVEFPMKTPEMMSLSTLLIVFIYLFYIFILIDQYKEGNSKNFLELLIGILVHQWGGHLALLTAIIGVKMVKTSMYVFYINLWDHTVFSLELQKKIKYESRKAMAHSIIIFCLFICVYISFNTFLANDICTPFSYFDRHSLHIVGIFVVNTIYFFCVVGYTIPIAYFIYVCVQIKIQVLILNEYLENLLDTNLNFDMLLDEAYQNFVHEKLKNFVNQHLTLLSVYEITLKDKHKYLTMYLICAVTVVFAVAYFLASGLHPQSNFRIYIIIFTYFMNVLIFCAMSQQLKDKFDELLNTSCKLPWIYWNKNNRLSLLIIMSRLEIPFEVLNMAGLCDLSHIFLLKMARISYSIITMVWNLRK